LVHTLRGGISAFSAANPPTAFDFLCRIKSVSICENLWKKTRKFYPQIYGIYTDFHSEEELSDGLAAKDLKERKNRKAELRGVIYSFFRLDL